MHTAPRSEWARYYSSTFGLKLTHPNPGTKIPEYPRWNEPPEEGKPGGYLDTPEAAEAFFRQHPNHNFGVVLGASGLASFDDDQPDLTRIALAAVGFDPDLIFAAGAQVEGNP